MLRAVPQIGVAAGVQEACSLVAVGAMAQGTSRGAYLTLLITLQ